MSNAQHWALNKPTTAPADLTAAQKLAYRQTGVAMSDSEARQHLHSQAELQRVARLHRQVATTATTATTASDTPPRTYTQSKSLEQLRVEALIETDAELMNYIGAVLRNRWTKAAALVLACTVTLLVLTGCSGDHREEGSFSPALAPAASAPAATH